LGASALILAVAVLVVLIMAANAARLSSRQPSSGSPDVAAIEVNEADAVARLSQVDGTREAEFAILVSHFISGRGLGRLLLKKLVAYARRRKLDAIHGDVLDDNTPMLQLAQTLGFHRETSEHTGMTRMRLVLAREHDAMDRAAH